MHYAVSIRDRVKLEPSPDEELREKIREALTVTIPSTPDKVGYYIRLFHEYTPSYDSVRQITMPRGFLKQLLYGLQSYGHTYHVTDFRIKQGANETSNKRINLMSHQVDAVAAILEKGEGIVVAPPAAGKTVLTLEAIRRSGCRALIIVDKKNIAEQWKARCLEFLGITPVMVGGDYPEMVNDYNMITIAMQQTISNRINAKTFVDNYSFVVLDECHHVSADTYTRVFDSFGAVYRIGISATPFRDDGLELITKMTIGNVIYEIGHEELQASKILIKPSIHRTATHFSHNFWGTHSVTSQQVCDMPGCRKNGTKHGHKNNYHKVTTALVEDEVRNIQIARKICENMDKCNLIVSDRLEHLETLMAMCAERGFPSDRMHMLVGKKTAAERNEIIRIAGYGSCAIFSTIAKEALDIPRLDRLYLTWPIRKDHILEQQIGRIARRHPDKTEAKVYDFVDSNCSVLANQSHDRMRFYQTKNYTIRNQ